MEFQKFPVIISAKKGQSSDFMFTASVPTVLHSQWIPWKSALQMTCGPGKITGCSFYLKMEGNCQEDCLHSFLNLNRLNRGFWNQSIKKWTDMFFFIENRKGFSFAVYRHFWVCHRDIVNDSCTWSPCSSTLLWWGRWRLCWWWWAW